VKITISVINADMGSIGGHICPSQRSMATVDAEVTGHKAQLACDSDIGYNDFVRRDKVLDERFILRGSK
jgi:hypothetical protein